MKRLFFCNCVSSSSNQTLIVIVAAVFDFITPEITGKERSQRQNEQNKAILWLLYKDKSHSIINVVSVHILVLQIAITVMYPYAGIIVRFL